MTEWLLAALAAIVAVIAAWIGGKLSGAKAERDANRAGEADTYEKHLQEIADAAAARNAVRPDVMPDADPYRRD